MDTLSASLPIDTAMNLSLDIADSQQTVNISSQILQSPNFDPSSRVTPDRAVARQVFGFGQRSRMTGEGDTNAR